MAKKFAVILILIGSVLLLSVSAPIVFSQVKFQLAQLLSPIDPSVSSTAVSEREPVFLNVLGYSATDYTLPSNWFPSQDSDSQTPITKTNVKSFTLTIPDLNMLEVPVEVNGADLKQNAIHYAGTALPGGFGNSVIFGHSALPQFYSSGDPLTIFNPLVKAKEGMQILAKFDGVLYVYAIKKIQEVTPDKIQVLGQDFSRHTLTLITCTPLGTYWHRFVVTAELVN